MPAVFPYRLGYSATVSPDSGSAIRALSHPAAARSLLPRHPPPARYRLESMSIRPYLSAFRISHRIGSKRVDGRGISASRSAAKRSMTDVSADRWWRLARASPSQRPSMTRVSCPWDSASRGGTMRLRRRNPTAFSTLPFSLPEYGLQNLASILWRERNASNTLASVTCPFASRCPAPVALSSTSTGGTPPTCPNTRSSPWHRHSAFSPGMLATYRMFECGNVTTRQWSSTHSPAIPARATPKSTCAVPGAHSGSQYPPEGAWLARLHRLTYRWVVEYSPS